MRFLIDADLPGETKTLVSSYGHVAIDVRDVGLGSASDTEIAAYALQHGFCLVSADWGFSDIRVYPPERYAGIVVIGLPVHATAPMFLEALSLLLERNELIALLPGRLVIVEKNRIRLRPPQ